MSFIDSIKTWSAKYTKKAAIIETNNAGNTGLQLITGNVLDQHAPCPKELVKLNQNYVYACNNRIATTLAQNELKLFMVKNKSQNLLNQNRQGKITKSINLQDDENVVEILDHPFLNLMINVNDTMNYFDFASWTQSYLGLIGNAYALIIKQGNTPVALEPLLGEDVTIVLDKPDGNIMAYKYHKLNYAPEDILHFVNYNPGSRISGRGELEGCLLAAQLYDFYMEQEAYMCKNNCRPDFALTFSSMLSEKEQRDLQKILKKQFAGKNAGLPLVTGDAKITPLGLSPRDMQNEKGKEWCRQEIMAAYGVPDSLMLLSSSNWASAKEALRIFNELTIYPKLNAYCSKLTEKLLPMFDPSGKLFVWYDTMPDEQDPTQKANMLKTYVDAGIMTVNEAREQLLMEPKEEVESPTDGLEALDKPEENQDEK